MAEALLSEYCSVERAWKVGQFFALLSLSPFERLLLQIITTHYRQLPRTVALHRGLFGLRGFWLSRPLLFSFRGILVYELFYFRAIISGNFAMEWRCRV